MPVRRRSRATRRGVRGRRRSCRPRSDTAPPAGPTTLRCRSYDCGDHQSDQQPGAGSGRRRGERGEDPRPDHRPQPDHHRVQGPTGEPGQDFRSSSLSVQRSDPARSTPVGPTLTCSRPSIANAGRACPCCVHLSAGWKSSTTLPDGSSSRICCPPGPDTMSFRNLRPAALSGATSAAMSLTTR